MIQFDPMKFMAFIAGFSLFSSLLLFGWLV